MRQPSMVEEWIRLNPLTTEIVLWALFGIALVCVFGRCGR